MTSTSAQYAEVAWYSVRVPGSQSSRQDSSRLTRRSRSAPSSGRIGARGKPAVWVSRCSIVTSCLPFAPNSGTTSATRVVSRSEPSPISSQAIAALNALVTLKVT